MLKGFMMFIRLFLTVRTILYCFALNIAAMTPVLPQQSSAGLVTLNIVISPHLSSGPMYIADEEGFFTREGIQIVYSNISRTRATLPSLISNDVDLILGALNPGFFNAIARGSNLRLVAGVHTPSNDDCNSFGLVVGRKLAQKGAQIRPSDLRGLNIGGERSGFGQFFFEILLAQDGLTLDDIELVDAPLPARPELLKKGLIDAAFLGEPQITLALEDPSLFLWKPVQDVLPNPQITFIFYGQRLLEQDPELGKKFLVGYLRGVEQYRRGKTQRNIEILSKHTGLDSEYLKRVCWSPAQEKGSLMLDYIKEFQAWNVRRGLADQEVPLKKLWDGRFLENAYKVLQQEQK